MIKHRLFVSFIIFVSFGLLWTYVLRNNSSLNIIYTDRHGETWKVSPNKFLKKIVGKIIDETPRVTKKFVLIDQDFDPENGEYLGSCEMFIILFGMIGVIFAIWVSLFLTCRYYCGRCGGTSLPRLGYLQSSINSTRLSIVIFSFFLEGILIHGYFSNRDAHRSLKKLVKTFSTIGKKIEENTTKLIESFPIQTASTIYNQNRDDFIKDLNYSIGRANSQSKLMSQYTDKYESIRMWLILLNLILASISCSLGIAAGNISRGNIMLIMVILNVITGLLIFFSCGIHFAGSKSTSEYCNEISYYIEETSTEIIPMRLQFFAPCLNSPILYEIEDHYVIEAVYAVNKFNEKLKLIVPNSYDSPAFWFNITDKYYFKLAKNNNFLKLYDKAYNSSQLLILFEDLHQCKYTKEEIKGEYFLFCRYLRDNLNMITFSQLVGGIILIILTIIGVPAIKKFKWARSSRMNGILNANVKRPLLKPRPKRKK